MTNTIHLFAGAGGGILADLLLGHTPRVAVEIDANCRSYLAAKQDHLHLDFHDDIRTYEPSHAFPIHGICAGFPCQDASAAACPKRKQRGVDGERTGLVWEAMRVIEAARPAWVFLENSPRIANLGLNRILGSLADLGFDAEWTTLSAQACGAWHKRDRLWLLAAHPDRQGQHAVPLHAEVASASSAAVPNPDSPGRAQQRQPQPTGAPVQAAQRDPGWPPEPPVGRVAHGLAGRVGQLRALGNGQVPVVAAVAWRHLASRLGIW